MSVELLVGLAALAVGGVCIAMIAALQDRIAELRAALVTGSLATSIGRGLVHERFASTRPTVVLLVAEWCESCSSVAGWFAADSELASSADRWLLSTTDYSVDLNDLQCLIDPGLVSSFLVQGCPTAVLLDPSGREIHRRLIGSEASYNDFRAQVHKSAKEHASAQ